MPQKRKSNNDFDLCKNKDKRFGITGILVMILYMTWNAGDLNGKERELKNEPVNVNINSAVIIDRKNKLKDTTDLTKYTLMYRRLKYTRGTIFNVPEELSRLKIYKAPKNENMNIQLLK